MTVTLPVEPPVTIGDIVAKLVIKDVTVNFYRDGDILIKEGDSRIVLDLEQQRLLARMLPNNLTGV